MRRHVPLLIVISAFVWSCGHDGTGPSNPFLAGIRKLVGPGTDTVAARPIQALTVQVRELNGVPARGKVVRFESQLSFGPFGSGPYVLVSSLTTNQFGSLVAANANDDGQASTLVQMGPVAGEAKLLVSVPEIGMQDTLRFTIMPGAPARVNFTVRDTALMIGGTWTPNPSVVDQFNNKRSETPSLANATPSRCTLAGTLVSAIAMGRCLITATYQQARDTARANILPQFKLAVVRDRALATVNADGTGYQTLLQTQDFSLAPDWSPDGQTIVIYEGNPDFGSKISIVNMSGVRVKQVGGDATLATAFFGRFSPDGQWVYFSAAGSSQPLLIWRMHPDGTQLEPILTPTAEVAGGQRPSVSPDGQTIAFDYGGKLALLDVATKQPTALGVSGTTPAFSPNGQSIAYVGANSAGLFVANRDGTNVRQIRSSQFSPWQSPQWTADGQWVLARDESGGGLLFVNVNDQSIVSLPSAGNYIQGARKP